MKEKYDEHGVENLLKNLKNKDICKPSGDFTLSVMDRIKNSAGKPYYDDENIEILLKDLKNKRAALPSGDFSSSVMNRIKEYENIRKTPFDEKNIEPLLKTLKYAETVVPSERFAASVIDKIREDENNAAGSFYGIYRKFITGAIVAAAASVLLAVNLFSSFDPGTAELMVTDYFNTGIY